MAGSGGVIVPTKGVRPERSLLFIAGQVLKDLDGPTTVSGAWEALSRRRRNEGQKATVTFDWYVLALDLLRALGAIELSEGMLAQPVRPAVKPAVQP
jgi:hypothetical protein